MSGVSGPGVDPSCLGIGGMNDETGAEIGRNAVDASAVVKAVEGA